MEINNLIANFLTGKASQDELESLNQWKKESADNLKALEEMKSNWSALDNINEYEDYNPATAWEKLESNLDDSSSTRRVTRYLRPLGIAASIVLIVSCLWYFSNTEDTSFPSSYATENIQETINTLDGSEVKLAEFSSLEINQNFENQRSLELEGKAFFKVAHDKEKPFQVNTSHGSVTVLGTEFSVISTEEVFEVYVQSGSVAVDFNNRKIILKKGEACQLYNGDLAKFEQNDKNYLSWNVKKLVFQDASISEIRVALERHYGIVIDLDNNVLTNHCRINSVYTNESLENVLAEMKKVFNLEYTSKDNRYKFSDIKC